MKYKYKIVPIRARGSGLFTRTPTEGDIQRELGLYVYAGWRLVQVLTLGLLIRQYWLVLEHAVDDTTRDEQEAD